MAIYVCHNMPQLSLTKDEKIGISFEQIMDECRWHIRAKLNELFYFKMKNSSACGGGNCSLPTLYNFSKVSCVESNYPSAKNKTKFKKRI